MKEEWGLKNPHECKFQSLSFRQMSLLDTDFSTLGRFSWSMMDVKYEGHLQFRRHLSYC